MMRKIKGLGVALVAIAAMSMVAAAGAQATQIHATNPGQHAQVLLHGEQKLDGLGNGQHTFTTNAGTVKCNQATFEGTATPTADELQLTGTYTSCQAFGQQAIIDMNGCKYTITGTQATAQTWGTKTAAVDVSGCTSGKSIEITTAICRMTVPQQNNIQHMTFENTAGVHHDVTVEVTGAGISYQADGPLCPGMPTGQTLANGTYTGKATIQAYTSTGSVQVTHNGHQYAQHTKAATALGLQVT